MKQLLKDVNWVKVIQIAGQALVAGAAGYAAGGPVGAATAVGGIVVGLIQEKKQVLK